MMGPEAMVYSHRRNLNRGYMKLEVWNDAIELFALVHKILDEAHNLDLRLKGQILDAAQSVSANIAEGYGRKSINEYLYFLNVAWVLGIQKSTTDNNCTCIDLSAHHSIIPILHCST